MENLLTLDTLVRAYFGVNLFWAGYYLADTYAWNKSRADKFITILICIATGFIGCVWITLMVILAILKVLYEWIERQTQIGFLCAFYFTKKWDNPTPELLQTINKNVENRSKSRKLKDRTFCYCAKLLNARLNSKN